MSSWKRSWPFGTALGLSDGSLCHKVPEHLGRRSVGRSAVRFSDEVWKPLSLVSHTEAIMYAWNSEVYWAVSPSVTAPSRTEDLLTQRQITTAAESNYYHCNQLRTASLILHVHCTDTKDGSAVRRPRIKKRASLARAITILTCIWKMHYYNVDRISIILTDVSAVFFSTSSQMLPY